MDFSVGALMASLIAGSIGMGLVVYGRKQRRVPHLVVGLALIVFPYFLSSALLIGAIAIGLLGLLWLLSRLGY